MTIKRLLAVLTLLCGVSFAQLSRIHSDVAFRSDGRPAGGASIRICTAAAAGVPCSPLASIYSDAGLTVPKANPFTADSQGNYTYYAAPGYFKEQVNVGGAIYTHPVQLTDPDVDDLLALKADLVAGKVPPTEVATGDTSNSTLCVKGGTTFAMGACGSGGSSGDATTIQNNAVASGSAANKGEGYFYNGTSLTLRKGPFDNDARDWGCDSTGATSATTCLQSVFDAVSTSNGQSVYLPKGIFLIGANTTLHVRRNMTIQGAGAGQSTPATTLKLGPGSQIVFDKSTVSSDGGGGDWTVFKGIAVIGTSMTCTATASSGTLASCNQNPSTFLSLAAGDYVIGGATAGSPFIYRTFFAHGTTVSSLTSNSITLAGGVTSDFTGTVTVMKDGPIVSTGTSSSGSGSITGVATACALWQPGDYIMGPGLTPPTVVTGCNTGASTLTVSPVAGSGFGAGSFAKGPLPSVAVHAGSVVLEDDYIDTCAGHCYDNHGSAAYSPATIADGNYVIRLRVLNGFSSAAHWQGADSNAGHDIGIQATRFADGCLYDQSFLGNTHINPECASSAGAPYRVTGANSATSIINPYIEGGQSMVQLAGQTQVLGGYSGSNTGGLSNGTWFTGAGRLSPNVNMVNFMGGASTATCTASSNSLTNVTQIAQWHVGDTINADCLAASTTVTATDGVSTLTISANATRSGDLLPITQTITKLYVGAPSTLQGAFGFGHSSNNSTYSNWFLEYDDPAYRVAGTYEPGFYSWRYKNSGRNMSFPTDFATNADDQVGTPGTTAPMKFANGIRVGGNGNSPAIKANASASAPTSGEWQNGSLAISTTTGFWQQRGAGKSTTGLADLTSGSTALANQDSNFLGRCAPSDRVSGTGIQTGTILTDQNTLSKAATATNTGVTVTCKRIAKAHVATTCNTSSGTATLLSCSTISGWSQYDYITGTGIPAGSFITVAPSGSTITISQNASATNTGVAVSDASFVTGLFSDAGSTNSFTLGNTTFSNITGSAQCLHVNSAGQLSGTGSDCGSSGAGASPGGSNGDVQYNNAGVFGGIATTGSGSIVRATGASLATPSITSLTFPGIVGSIQCLHVDALGLVSGTGTDCGAGGGGPSSIKSMSSYASAQAALTALASGQTLLVDGTFTLCNGTISTSNVKIIGAGSLSGILQCSTNNQKVLTVSGNGVTIQGIKFKHITNSPISGGDGLVIAAGTTNVRVVDNEIDFAYNGLTLGNTSYGIYQGNYISGNNNDGVVLSSDGSSQVMQWRALNNISLQNLGDGFDFTLGASVTGLQTTCGTWVGNTAYGNGGYGYKISASAATTSGISDCFFDAGNFASFNNNSGFYLDAGPNGGRNNHFLNGFSELSGQSVNTAGFAGAALTPSNVGHGIEITSSCDPTIAPIVSNFQFWENSYSGAISACTGTQFSEINAYKNGMAASANSYERAAVALRASQMSVLGGYFRDSGSKQINGVDISNSADKLTVQVNCETSIATCVQQTTTPTNLTIILPGSISTTGSFTTTGTAGTGTVRSTWLLGDQGTAQSSGNIAISGWGSGAAVSAVTGYSQRTQFTITAGTSPSASPTIIVTFPDTAPVAPVCYAVATGGNDTISTLSTGTPSTTTSGTLTWVGTPTNTKTYKFLVDCR